MDGSLSGPLPDLVRDAQSDNPTAWVDHVRLFDTHRPVPDDENFSIPFGVADIKRTGGDVTLFASSWLVTRALEAAEILHAEGIEAEVIDPRTLSPLDEETILESIAKTGRLVVVDECHRRRGVAAEIMAVATETLSETWCRLR